jgi:hypothetical protein
MCNQRGKEWPSDFDVAQAAKLLAKDKEASTLYIAIADMSNENVMREWTQMKLNEISARFLFNG